MFGCVGPPVSAGSTRGLAHVGLRLIALATVAGYPVASEIIDQDNTRPFSVVLQTSLAPIFLLRHTHTTPQNSQMSSAPPFGTASAYTDSFPAPPPKALTISAETCFNLSVFKGEPSDEAAAAAVFLVLTVSSLGY